MTLPRRPIWLPVLALIGLALGATVTGLGNGFAYDDVPVVAEDVALRAPATALPRAFEPYLGGQMLRPVLLLGFAAQWWVGLGNPLSFRLTSLILYATASALVLLFLRASGLAPWPSFFGAAIFAVHPVHVEVTANAVGQAELLSTGFVLAAAVWYLHARRRMRWRMRDTAAITALFLLAAHSKEVGYVLPGLLVLLEVLVVRDPRPLRVRLDALREPVLWLILAVVASLGLRSLLLGSLRGGEAHLVLAAFTPGERLIAMLPAVSEWARLLLWPARLQADYGPPAVRIVPSVELGHLVGLGILVGWAGLLVWTWRRAPLIAAGLLWIGLALSPVANVLFATEVLVAERTLFLPSVGLVLLLAAVAAWANLALQTRWRIPLATAGAALVLLGGVRSALRQPEWRDSLTLHASTVRDAPANYRARTLYGRELLLAGDTAGAERELRAAASLWRGDSRPFRDLGQLLRTQGRCSEGVVVLREAMMISPNDEVARSRLVECLIEERRWDDAEGEIERGLAQGVTAYQNALSRVAAGRQAEVPE